MNLGGCHATAFHGPLTMRANRDAFRQRYDPPELVGRLPRFGTGSAGMTIGPAQADRRQPGSAQMTQINVPRRILF
jgi:hypothetical protein